jgi:hypothetical protein
MSGLVISLIACLGGCGITDEVVCTGDFRFGIRLSVVDSITAGQVDASEVIVKATEGSYVDSLRLAPNHAVQIGRG